MTESEIEQSIQKLKGLFPMTTEEQIKFWAERFVHREFRHVDRAIERFAERHSDFVDRAGLLDLINAEQRRDAADKRQQIMREQKMVAADWEKINAIVLGCTDQDLEDLKAAALAMSQKLNEGAKKMLEKMNPRTSKTLRWLIFQYLEHAPRHVAAP